MFIGERSFLRKHTLQAGLTVLDERLNANPIAVLRKSLGHEFDLLVALELKRKRAVRRASVIERGRHRRRAGSVSLNMVGAPDGAMLVQENLPSRQISASVEDDFAFADF